MDSDGEGGGVGALYRLGCTCTAAYEEFLKTPHEIYTGPLPGLEPVYVPRTDYLHQHSEIVHLKVRPLHPHY